MPLHSAEALVLRTYRFGEADLIVVFLTRDRGKKRGVARGARRSRKRFAASLEPMSRVRVDYVERDQRELVAVNFAELVQSPLGAVDPEALGYVGYFAELIDECAPESHADERLFRLGAAVVDTLQRPVPVRHLARYFEYWLLRLQGVYPGLRACGACRRPFGEAGAFLVRAMHGFVCGRCAPVAGPADLSEAALAFLRAAAATPPDRLGEFALDPKAAGEIERVHRALIVEHLEREPRSGRVLRAIGSPPGPTGHQRMITPMPGPSS